MRYLRALWRGVKMILGLNFEPFEPIDEESLDEWAARRPRER